MKSERHSDRNIFEIISLSQQRCIFECKSGDERDEWVRLIASEIKTCLQGPCTDVLMTELDPAIGNKVCVDCGDDNPECASVKQFYFIKISYVFFKTLDF